MRISLAPAPLVVNTGSPLTSETGDALELLMNMWSSLASWLGTDACFDRAEVECCSSKLDCSNVRPRDEWTEYTSDAPKLEPRVPVAGVVGGGGAPLTGSDR
jgi:hypothetical protein